MATSYLYPGIYIEEVSSGARPIEAVGTSTAGFVGEAPNAEARVNELVWINNWTEFCKEFVSGGNASTPLSHAVHGFFLNGGGRCCVVNVGAGGSLVGSSGRRAGLDLLEQTDEVAIVAIPGRTDVASYDAALSHCEKLKDRVAILDAPDEFPSIDALTRVGVVEASGKAKSKSPAEVGESQGLRPRQSDGGYGAVYFPHLIGRDPLAPQNTVLMPPSGHVAGIYARTDATRGVHKAPANESVRGALGVSRPLTAEEQGVLNPKGVNCIRFFPAEGIRVFGARTLADSSSEWRYVSVRRLLNMIEESIARSTRWVVFEPNDQTLWKSLRRDVGAFLTSLWRQGALSGKTPEEAFFVKCDSETNPKEEVDQGRLFILVGVAPVKPAEFIIFRIGQSVGGAESQS